MRGAYSVVQLVDRIVLRLPSGVTTSFDNTWLKDHSHYHPTTKQRLVDTPTIPSDIKPTTINLTKNGLKLTWPFTQDPAFYTFQFLHQYAYNPPLPSTPPTTPKPLHWTSHIGKDPPTLTHQEIISSDQGLYTWLNLIDQYGFCFVSGIPPTPQATEALVRRIAFVRETHYGAFWDFEADGTHGDLAYGREALRAHTDTTYLSDPCGLQIFHLLSPLETHQGGLNLLVDGFRVAAELKISHPEIYKLFSTIKIPSHASGIGHSSLSSGVHMKPLLASSVFTHSTKGSGSGEGEEEGELKIIRWNSEDRDTIGGQGWEGDRMKEWYQGVKIWEERLRNKQAELWTQMIPGTAIIFNNHRILHGRSSFTGKRRLCGAYISGDDYRSRLIGLRKIYGH